MNQQQALALGLYINRAMGIIPTTGLEWSAVQGALATIQAVANGEVEIDINPVGKMPDAPPAPPRTKARRPAKG